MSRLLIVRHGQASAGDDDYDRLSPTGWQQAESLGRHWRAGGLVPDAVWVGPCRRHRETAEGVRRGLGAAGDSWPAAEALAGLDEHSGYQVFARSLPELAAVDPEARRALELLEGDTARDRRLFYRVYRRVTFAWVRGELEPPGPAVEPFDRFRQRTESALRRLTDGPRGRTVVAFTSAGPTGVAVASSFGLDNEKALELSWMVLNSAVSEFLFSNGRFSLRSFNTLPHLDRPELETWV